MNCLENAIDITISGQHLIKYLASCFDNYFRNDFWKDKRYFATEDPMNAVTSPIVRAGTKGGDAAWLNVNLDVVKGGAAYLGGEGVAGASQVLHPVDVSARPIQTLGIEWAAQVGFGDGF